MTYLRAAATAYRVTLKIYVVEPFAYMQVIIQPLVFGGVALILFAIHHQSTHLQYAILGGGLVGLWSVTLFGGGYSIGSERWSGTLEEIFSCPTPIYVIALGKITAMMTLGIVSFLVSIGLALVYLHSLFATFDPIPFAISALVTMIGFLSIALVLAPIFCVTRNALWYANAAEFPVDLFAGFMFPIGLLVGWTHPLSYAIPVTWSVNGLNAAAGSGAGITQYLFWWAMGLLVSCVYFAAAVPAFAWADRTARVNGELQAI